MRRGRLREDGNEQQRGHKTEPTDTRTEQMSPLLTDHAASR